MADLRIENLNKNFGAFSAVRDVNITVHEGEFIFLLGPSGCGKTTTLRMIAGLEMPTSGRIEIGRRNVTFLRPRYRNVGMVFQDYGLYRHMTVFGNISYPLEVRKLSRQAISDKVRAVASTMQITDVLSKKPDQLSAGQLQRVAIARAIVLNPKYLFCDEPNSGLDPETSIVIDQLIQEITREFGMTTVVNTRW